MATLNIGILAHIDAGKTSLTERILFDTGVIERLGSVDAGTTQTDAGDIERRRGITIRTAVASFMAGSLQVNLIDTPGHSDFIAEVERALGVLDGAILVISAVEGVQAQTRVLMRTLRAMRLPTLIFINKIDRLGARTDELLEDIGRKLSARVIPMNRVKNIGSPLVRTTESWAHDPARVLEILADGDDALIADVISGNVPSRDDVTGHIAAQTAAGLVHPVFFGSARGGQGVPDLLDGVRRLLPPAAGDETADARGTVFAIERGRTGEKVAYLRLFAGTLRPRQQVSFFRRESSGVTAEHTGHLTALDVVGPEPRDRLAAGAIAKIRGLPGIRVGDRLGVPDESFDPYLFALPSLETLALPRRPEQGGKLHAALMTLAEQDPLISTRATAGGTSVLLYGEIQKEIIAETLARDFGVEANFEPSRTVYAERPAGTGSAMEPMGHFIATVGLRVEPASVGAGIVYRRETEPGALPVSFHRAIEDTVYQTLTQGLSGWPVVDCVVTLTHTGYDSVCSTGADFRHLTPLVLARALARAGTRVYEPCHAFELEMPLEVLSAVAGRLIACEATIAETTAHAASWVVAGEIPARRVPEFVRELPKLTFGEGAWWSRPQGDRLFHGPTPTRPRTDGNPLNRAEYLRHLSLVAR